MQPRRSALGARRSALGARIGKSEVGTIGDIGCFSFNGNKVITAGGHEMIVTDNADLAA
jgi:perosamine synthetase